jgi:methionyl-tRNA formyltransferase
VVTTPDKPAGRGLKLTSNPVKLLALNHHIQIIETMNDLMTMNDNRMTNSVGLVAAYGKIIPSEILRKFNNQIYNIHPSLLPKYRGPSPLQYQILDGVTETGVTIIQLDELMDHGPIVAVQKDTIHPDDTWITLGERLFSQGTDLFLSLLNTSPTPPGPPSPRLGEGLGVRYTPQDENLATYTHKLTRASGFVKFETLKNYLDLGICDLDIPRMLRAFAGWPGVWTTTPEGHRLKLLSLSPTILVQLENKVAQPWPIVV